MIAVAGGKGGTGKTTTALGLARALASAGQRPVVIDADVDLPDLAVAVGIPDRPGVDAVAGGAAVARVGHPDPIVGNVTVVPAEPGADLSGALPALRETTAAILDCPGGAAADAVVPLEAAEAALLVTTAEREAIEDTLKTATMAEALGTTIHGVIVSRSDSVPQRLVDRCNASFGEAVPAVDGPPLGAPPVQAAYRRLAGRLSRSNLKGLP